jgi:hypothetical protein
VKRLRRRIVAIQPIANHATARAAVGLALVAQIA